MIYYLNRGFIAEQAIADILNKYFHKLNLEKLYENYHIQVTNNHPFAHLIIHDDAINTADMFPSIVVTTQNDSKINEMFNVPVQINKVALTKSDLEAITKNERYKTKFVDGQEVAVKNKKGEYLKEVIPGYCTIIDEDSLEKLKKIAEKDGEVFGLNYISRKRDRISIEIWCENNQLKNELYEQLRIFLSTSFPRTLHDSYSIYEPEIFDHSINGERSNNYNFDFDLMLYGSHISFEMDYTISQIIIDTDLNTIEGEIIPEVINHVKESR